MTKFSFIWPRGILMPSLFSDPGNITHALSLTSRGAKTTLEHENQHRSIFSKCHFNFDYEFGGDRFRSICWLLGGCTLVCGIFLSGVFQEGGSPPPGPEKGPEGSSKGGPG